jgi:glycosyltransferase involved in cell wall biosynthesis
MSEDKSSIVIPVHNSEKTIIKTLESCLVQSYSNFEIICVDDCSTDNSPLILKQYAEKDGRIHCILLEKNINSYMARKTAIRHVTGDYVLFLDSDDSFSPNAFEALAKKFRHSNADIVFFGYTNVPGGNKILPLKLKTMDEYLAVFFVKDSYIPSAMWTRAYKKTLILEAFSKMNDFTAFMAEDVYVSIVIHSCAKSIVTLNKSLVNYSIGGNSNTRGFNASFYEARLKSYKIIFDQIIIFVNKYKPEYIKHCNNILIRFVKEFIDKIPSDLPDHERTLLINILRKYIDDDIIFMYIKEANTRWICFQDYQNVYRTRINQILHGIKYLIKCIIGLRCF